MSFFFILVIFAGWGVSWYFDSPLLLIIAVGIALFLNISAYWYSDTIALRLSKATPVTRKEYFDVWNSLENLSIVAGVPMPKLYIMKDDAPNAFATGRNPEHSAVVVTTGLLSLLTKEEVEGVLAHELSHIINRDTLIMTTTVVLVGILTILADIVIRSHLWGGGRSGKGGAFTLILIIIALIITPLVAQLLKMAVSRKREYNADATSVLLTRHPEGLASALLKISSAPRQVRTAHAATAHLFISSPLKKKGEKKEGMMEKFFSTHPPIKDRVAALRGTERSVGER